MVSVSVGSVAVGDDVKCPQVKSLGKQAWYRKDHSRYYLGKNNERFAWEFQQLIRPFK